MNNADFPNLNMSIGEYYKILMEGKRPTRQRTAKEDQKMGAPPQLTRGASTQQQPPSHLIKGGQSGALPPPTGLLRSQSEVPGMLRHQASSKIGGQSSTERQHVHGGNAKRKLKMKNKLKHHQRQRSTPSTSKPLEERKSPGSSALFTGGEKIFTSGQTPEFEGNAGHKTGKEISGTGGEDFDAQAQTYAKLRHRSNQPSKFDKSQKNMKKRMQQSQDHQHHHKGEKAAASALLAQKFEMVEVHPLFAKGRFATMKENEEQKGDEILIRLQRVKNIQEHENQDKYELYLGNKGDSFDFNQAIFASKVFIAPLSLFQEKELIVKKLSIPSTHQDQNILVTQLVPCHQKISKLRFAALLPSSSSDGILVQELSTFEPTDQILKALVDLENHEKAYEQVLADHPYLKGVIKVAQTLNEAYDGYDEQTSKIAITKDNLEDYMCTLVNYVCIPTSDQQPSEQDASRSKSYKQGVLLRAKLDTQFYNEHIIFIKKLGGSSSKSNSKVKSEVKCEWLQLSKYRIYCDISKGFISLDCLNYSDISNGDSTSYRLKKRHIRYVSFREGNNQKRSLRQVANVEMLAEDAPRKALMQTDSSNRPGDRCVLCNYQAQGYDHLRCSHCNKVFHEQCCLLQPKRLHQLYLGFRELQWRCPDCIRCVNCLRGSSSHTKSQSLQLLICKCCNSAYHNECLDPNQKLSLPNILTGDSQSQKQPQGAASNGAQLPIGPDIEFRCDQCTQCEGCGSREAGKNRMNKWSKDFKLCSNCNRKKKKKQYCTICESFWPDEHIEDAVQLSGEQINCGQCGIWVHYECDRIFKDKHLRQRFLPSAINEHQVSPFSSDNLNLQYHCPDCRQSSRALLIKQIIDNLANEDKLYIFQDPVEDLIANYTKIIKTPMCFAYIRDRAKTSYYLKDPMALRKDISLIFDNAMKFNLPKHKVHKEASRLGEVCQAVLDTVWSRLESNSLRTIDEDRFRDYLRAQRRFNLRQQLLGEGSKLLRDDIKFVEEEQKEEPQYQLRIEELFDASDFQLQQQVPNAGDQNGAMADGGNQVDPFNDDEDEEGGAQLDSDLDNEAMEGEDTRKTAKSQNKRKNLRQRKHVNYNEDGIQQLVGTKRGQEEVVISNNLSRGGFSSKKARYQQQQQQFSSSQFSFNMIGLKGANLLQQAVHQQEKQLLETQMASAENQQQLVVQQQQQALQPVNHFQQQQQMMMNYYQEVDDEKCYYSNPARCSFDDPHLAFEEMCYLCGSFGNREDFLSCTLCGESFHTYCLQLMPLTDDSSNNVEDIKALIARFQPYWKCLNCKFCDICSSATQEACLLYCDVCDKAFHSFCLTPPLKAIPKCQWKCQECFKCQKCNTRSFFDPTLHLNPNTGHLLDAIASTLTNDFEFSQNFSLCYECGMNEHKKSFCKICQSNNNSASQPGGGNNEDSQGQSTHQIQTKKSRAHQDQKQSAANGQDRMIKCTTCGYYSHIRCTRLLPPSLTVDDNNLDNDSEELSVDFQCLECLLTGKSINHLIRETCEHYENMHNIIARQKLLAQLCSQILDGYFPMPEKAPLFIRAFIEQNQDFFKEDTQVMDWLSLLETGVCFNNEDSSTLATAGGVIDPEKKREDTEMAGAEDQKDKDEEQKRGERVGRKEWNIDEGEIYSLKREVHDYKLSPGQDAYSKLYSHKEQFLPPKRNLYEALASDVGYHRFGQRQHFVDPFAPEIQAQITLPLGQEIDFSELYVQIELKAVMKIKLKFFDWFETMLRSIVLRQSKKHKVKQIQQVDSNSAADQSVDRSSFVMGTMDPPSQIDLHPHHQHNQQIYCTEEDIQVENPQKRLQCIMCKLKGELTVTGRLIPFQVNQFVHVNCALWSTDVHEIAEGGYLVNFFQIWTSRAKFTRCNHCGEPGASLFCSSTRSKCFNAYHFPCAYRNKKMSFAPRGAKETFCEGCCKGQRGVHVGLQTEYANTKRRFQIAKNQQPWNMTHHMTSPLLQQQSQILLNINGSTSAADIEKPLQIEKWRPFFFDMFNRVGNLTVLSLRKEINQIIEEYCQSTTLTKQSDNGSKELNDFATMRIYWDYLNPKPSQLENQDMIETSRRVAGAGDKLTYLYSNNTLKEVINQDLEALLPYVSHRLKEKVSLGLHYMCQDNPESLTIINEKRNNQEPINQQQFWQQLMQHFQQERARFSLQNIIFSMSEFSGKTKYPVSIWNRGAEGVKNKAFFLRSGEQVLQQQQNQSTGAGGASEQPLEMTVNGGAGNPVIGFRNALGTLYPVQPKKGETTGNAGGGQSGKGASHQTIDDIFRRMAKINQMGEHQNPMASVKRVNASKHMPYEAVLQNLGKKMFYRAPPANSALFEDQGPTPTGVPAQPQGTGSVKQKQGSGTSALAKGGAGATQKKIKQTESGVSGQQGSGTTDANFVSKESDLPIPMKYRMSKTQPKRVEVGPSKIHRNGLFVLEDLAGGDIVIEYVGEKIRHQVADKREAVYEQKGIGDCYLFKLDKDYIIDATFQGNKARYLNHSCDANCSAKIITVQQQKHIIICANRAIKSGEELTYNYNFDYEADKIECFCGAPGCLGRLN